VLDTVTSTFNLKDHGRSDGNGRGYLVNSVRKLIDSVQFKERLKLGELYGYFGHNLRQLTGKMDLDEVSVIQYKGKPVVIETVPSNRTIHFDVNDEGIVTHTQEILDTPSGRAVKAMRDAGVGGWSWAVMGVPTALGAIARSFHGFDFVKHPSYIDNDKMQQLFESVGVNDEDALLESMFESAGFDAGQSAKLLGILNKRSPSVVEYEEITQDVMMLESALSSRESELAALLAESANRSVRMLEAVRASPIFTSERQLAALSNMATDEDKEIVAAFFESLSKSITDLPLAGGQRSSLSIKENRRNDSETMAHAVSFTGLNSSPFAPRN
jgi:hypothetical protein